MNCKKMSKEGQQLSEWEWSAILHATPDQIRKRFREELTHLYSVGTLLDAIRCDRLLSHVLAYAWRDTYRLALVCKRFKDITRGRQYWAALARHALKGKMPPAILEQVNFFHGLEDNDPPHTFLHVLLAKVRGVVVGHPISKALQRGLESFGGKNRLAFYGFRLHVGDNHYCLDIQWENDKQYSLGNYYAAQYASEACDHIPVRRTFFGHPTIRRLSYLVRQGTHKSNCLVRYVEIFCPKKGKTWCGEPASLMASTMEEIYMYPSAQSMGYWK